MLSSQPPMKDNYRQLRITLTEEANNRWTIRALVKPLWAQWDERYVVLLQRFDEDREIREMTDVYRLLIELLYREVQAEESRKQPQA
jgi:hypothetical protein